MLKDYEKIFSFLRVPDMPHDLLDKIMFRIRQEKRLSLIKRRLFFFTGILISSVAAFMPVLSSAQNEFSKSGFSTFLSLFFSDFNTAVANWRTFSMALLETLPAVSLTTFLITILALFISLRFVVKDTRAILQY